MKYIKIFFIVLILTHSISANNNIELQKLTGIFYHSLKDFSPYYIELDGTKEKFLLKGKLGNMFKNVNPGTRIEVKGIIKTSLYDNRKDSTPAMMSRWIIFMQVYSYSISPSIFNNNNGLNIELKIKKKKYSLNELLEKPILYFKNDSNESIPIINPTLSITNIELYHEASNSTEVLTIGVPTGMHPYKMPFKYIPKNKSIKFQSKIICNPKIDYYRQQYTFLKKGNYVMQAIYENIKSNKIKIYVDEK